MRKSPMPRGWWSKWMLMVAHLSGCVSIAWHKVMEKAETQMIRNELYLAK